MDFLLKIVTKNIKAYEAFYLDYLSRIACVRSVNSSVAVTVIKESTALRWGFESRTKLYPVVFAETARPPSRRTPGSCSIDAGSPDIPR